jgi:ubiquinone/menaquinone biosynthesis C-methylase UbiE
MAVHDDYVKAQIGRYKDVIFSKGPETYRSASNYDLLYELGDFERGGSYHIADLACGSGLVGVEVAKRVRKNNGSSKITFIDVVPENLSKIRKGLKRDMRVSDVRNIEAEDGEFTHTYCRYAIKNMQPFDQERALKEIFRVTSNDGIFVLQDMVSPEGLKEFQNAERQAKNLAAGDTITKHNVPTEDEWFRLIEDASFMIDETVYRNFSVHTSEWVNSGQMSETGLKSYFDFLEQAKIKWSTSWPEYQIKKLDDGYKITYPVIFVKCKKKTK